MNADGDRRMMVEFLRVRNMKHMVSLLILVKFPANYFAAGYTYCAIASLSFLSRLPNSTVDSSSSTNENLLPGLTNIPATIRWLVSRQVGYRDEEDEDEYEDPMRSQREALAGVYKDGLAVPGLSFEDEEFVGFNGRCNKAVDTCYAYWVMASLDVSPMSSFSLY